MRKFQIVVLPGDGIGPEVIAEALRVLQHLASQWKHSTLVFAEHPCGAGEYLRNGDPLPPATMEASREADAVLLGAMGLPSVRWPSGTEMTPQLDLREQLDLYAGLRPIRLYHASHSPLKNYAAGEIDFVMFRENTEGLFFSRKNSVDFEADHCDDTLRITRVAAEKICRAAFEMAGKRRKHVTLVDKANVLPSMAYFRAIFDRVAAEYPGIATDRVYVDAASLYLVKSPQRFDVMVTENMFGDILSDLAAGLVGGMGMAPSGDIGARHAVFQPSHGSAPDIAGKGIANPVATILSAAMMLEWLARGSGEDAVELRHAASAIHRAVEQVCADAGNATRDLGGTVSTRGMGDLVIEALG
ncbi:MAG: isocitrate/isopropylmalate dehydrogenase family protein [Bryobacterales bacterium]|nr:isocitrate/isopropylmalate dehydrogenase family protein [Bryobacterales bacterium]